jgi:hypothetical protein
MTRNPMDIALSGNGLFVVDGRKDLLTLATAVSRCCEEGWRVLSEWRPEEPTGASGKCRSAAGKDLPVTACYRSDDSLRGFDSVS